MGSQSQSSQSQQDIWQGQRDFLERSFGMGQNLARQQIPGMQDLATGLARTAGAGAGGDARRLGRDFTQGRQAIGGGYMPLGRQAGQAASQAGRSALGQDMVGNVMRRRITGRNPYLQGTINSLGRDINQQTRRNLADVGAAAGMYGPGAAGGAREAIERGLVREAGLREFSQGAQDLRFADYSQRGQEALAYGQQQQLARQQQLGARQQQLAALQGAGVQRQQNIQNLSARQSLRNEQLNLGMFPYQQAWFPLQQFSSILGRPTVLTQGQGSGGGRNFSFGI
jgi:hypothetical protein